MKLPRVAVVTPYHQEETSTINRCRRSVACQSMPATHIMVADGHPRSDLHGENIEHLIMPMSHGDAGATPRAIAAISAFSRGYDAIAFLDADNTLEPVHVGRMVDLMSSHQVGMVTATRNICTRDGRLLYVDLVESNGEDFCDTNCMFLGRPCLHLLTYWVTDPAARLWSDRQFWHAIKQSGINRVHCPVPSVNYHSRWAWHYRHAGVEPPADSVWIDMSDDGALMHRQHSTT